jgi:hypothetical protein
MSNYYAKTRDRVRRRYVITFHKNPEKSVSEIRKITEIYVVYNNSDLLRINLIIAVDGTSIAQDSEVHPHPD